MIMKRNTPGCQELCGEHDECCSQDIHDEGDGCESRFALQQGPECDGAAFNMEHDFDWSLAPAAYGWTNWIGMTADVGTLVVYPCMFCDGDTDNDYFNAKLVFSVGFSIGGPFCVTWQIRALFTVPAGCKIEIGDDSPPYVSINVTQTFQFVGGGVTLCGGSGGFIKFCIDFRLQRKNCATQCCGDTGSLSNFQIRYQCKDAGSGANACCPTCP